MIKFLLVASFAESVIKFRGEFLQALLSKNIVVHVAAPDISRSGSICEQLKKMGVEVHEIRLRRTGTNPFMDLGTILDLWKLIVLTKPDYVMGYTVKPVIYGSIAAWLARTPYRFALVTGLGYAFTGVASGKRGFLKYLVQVLYRFSLSRAHGVFFQNPDDESLFRLLGLLPPAIPSFIVNGSGVDVLNFSVAPMPQRLSFLMIARLLGDKGVREYVAAARQVKIQYPEVDFNLVGWIDNNPDAVDQRELDEWVDSGTINFLGKLEDVRPAIASSAVYVLPSYREGTPRTVLEAMAMGRPVITTDAPGCRETVKDGENGFLVPVKAVDELAAAMIRFVEQPELLAQMGRRSRKIAEEKYDVSKVNLFMMKEMGIQ